MQAFLKIVKKLEEAGVVTNIQSARTAENIAIESESVVKDPNVSIPCLSQELGLSYGTL